MCNPMRRKRTLGMKFMMYQVHNLRETARIAPIFEILGQAS